MNTFSNVIHEYNKGNKINDVSYVAQNLITHSMFNNQKIFKLFQTTPWLMQTTKKSVIMTRFHDRI